MVSLIDTNVLVYAHDPRFPEKQAIARGLLRRGLAENEIVLPHQALVEFVAAATRPRHDLGGKPLVDPDAAYLWTEDLIRSCSILYPDDATVVTALRGVSAYGLSWFDAHLWAYAEANGVPEILSEDFEHGRHYGSVRVVDPFLSAAGELHQLPPLYDRADP